MRHGRILYLPEIHGHANGADTVYALAEIDGDHEYGLDGYNMETYSSWNRWLLSHHCSFLVWSLFIHTLPFKQSKPERYLWVYDEILTYTRLIDPIQYDTHIRPIMAAFWPGFSAVWSFEFQRLKSLLKLLPKNETNRPIHEAFQKCHLNHLLTAKTLVPSGRSLLQEIKRAGKEQPTSVESLRFAYDAMFLIQRTPVSREDLERQVLTKFSLLLEDAAQMLPQFNMVATQALLNNLRPKWLQ
ncbi:MAG: hypothetical protein ISP86_01245 [Shewanellaceae bacterium]|nr:hypothetical protein [Shewanellaceae bacterium]